MTPFQLEIMFHYAYHIDDFRGGDFSAPAAKEAIEFFTEEGLLVELKDSAYNVLYSITERGRFYIEHLCTTPLPENSWVIPEREQPKETTNDNKVYS